ncbi:hypothetical protein SCUCBS95973_001517 [Sporothrix curviconia]|uniref:gamma-glutamylcyclotransferase n=1 Tax=Sporothrix curviconia TaxID=1260050 RepID=A0ABP0AZ82_9PEZI
MSTLAELEAPPAPTTAPPSRPYLSSSPSTTALPRPARTLYFAYGSDMQMAYMAHICPKSRYVGRAVLTDYKWHINSLGLANLTKFVTAHAPGLVFEVDDDDVEALKARRYPLYKSVALVAQLHPAAFCLYRRQASWIVKNGGPAAVLEDARATGCGNDARSPYTERGLLAFISTDVTTDGRPDARYAEAINAAAADAMALGVEAVFFESIVQQFMPGRLLPHLRMVRSGKSTSPSPSPSPSPGTRSGRAPRPPHPPSAAANMSTASIGGPDGTGMYVYGSKAGRLTRTRKQAISPVVMLQDSGPEDKPDKPDKTEKTEKPEKRSVGFSDTLRTMFGRPKPLPSTKSGSKDRLAPLLPEPDGSSGGGIANGGDSGAASAASAAMYAGTGSGRRPRVILERHHSKSASDSKVHLVGEHSTRNALAPPAAISRPSSALAKHAQQSTGASGGNAGSWSDDEDDEDGESSESSDASAGEGPSAVLVATENNRVKTSLGTVVSYHPPPLKRVIVTTNPIERPPGPSPLSVRGGGASSGRGSPVREEDSHDGPARTNLVPRCIPFGVHSWWNPENSSGQGRGDHGQDSDDDDNGDNDEEYGGEEAAAKARLAKQRAGAPSVGHARDRRPIVMRKRVALQQVAPSLMQGSSEESEESEDGEDGEDGEGSDGSEECDESNEEDENEADSVAASVEAVVNAGRPEPSAHLPTGRVPTGIVAAVAAVAAGAARAAAETPAPPVAPVAPVASASAPPQPKPVSPVSRAVPRAAATPTFIPRQSFVLRPRQYHHRKPQTAHAARELRRRKSFCGGDQMVSRFDRFLQRATEHPHFCEKPWLPVLRAGAGVGHRGGYDGRHGHAVFPHLHSRHHVGLSQTTVVSLQGRSRRMSF